VPVKRPLEDLTGRWERTSLAYAHTVSLYGTGTPHAREAWEIAMDALEELVRSRSEEFKKEAAARLVST
jgi:hypothetical protein